MLKTILVPLSGLDSDQVGLECAYLAAELFGSHIDCMYVRPDPRDVFAQSTTFDIGIGGPVITPELWTAIEEEDKARTTRARHVFDEFCDHRKPAVYDSPAGSNGVSVSWLEVVGDVVHEVIRRARSRDMVLLSRAAEPAGWLGQTGDILVGCGRPVVLAPRLVPKTFATTISIAWKDTAEAARALTAAMPLLVKAKKVVILSADEGGNVANAIESAEELVRALRWDGVQAELRRLAPEARGVPKQLLTVASQEGADLMVMGGYSHSRARELVFGGVTRSVLSDAGLPVLLCH